MMHYNTLVEDCFFTPRHVGTLDCTKPLTASSEAGQRNRAFLQWYAACDQRGLMTECRFKAYGNPYLIAALEWCCRHMVGTALGDHPCFNYQHLVNKLDIPNAHYPVALLVEEGYRQLCERLQQVLRRACDE